LSLAPSKKPPSARPSFDLDYSIHDFEVDPHVDSQFLYKRVEQVMLDEACVPGGRSLDVACGAGQLAVAIHERGGEGWGLEPSNEMLGISRWLFPADKAVLARGVAEHLPFRAGSFDRVTCQGSLDHFVDPRAFMREAARLVKPGGYVIVALANYESLSCRIGRLWHRLDREVFRRPPPPHRKYWEIPADHFHRG